MSLRADFCEKIKSVLSTRALHIMAWQQFWTAQRLEAFESVKADFMHYGQYDGFESMHMRCDAPEADVRAMLNRLLIKPIEYEFERTKLFDPSAVAKFPLSAFSNMPSLCDSPPTLEVALTIKPWRVSLSWFSLKHRIRFHERRGDMWFAPQDVKCEPVRVAEQDFPIDTTRAVMFDALFSDVKKHARHVSFAANLRERTAILRAVTSRSQTDGVD